MRKIISLFQRDYDGNRQVFDEVVSGAEWVLEGEGIATQKHDGTAAMVEDGVLYKRYDVKKRREEPQGFRASQEPDSVTGHWPGWIPVTDDPADKWFREAELPSLNGTYELCGPKVQGNPERFERHTLILHGSVGLTDVPRTFEGILGYLATSGIEGVVWHHSDGRMAKIKTKDFGLKR